MVTENKSPDIVKCPLRRIVAPEWNDCTGVVSEVKGTNQCLNFRPWPVAHCLYLPPILPSLLWRLGVFHWPCLPLQNASGLGSPKAGVSFLIILEARMPTSYSGTVCFLYRHFLFPCEQSLSYCVLTKQSKLWFLFIFFWDTILLCCPGWLWARDLIGTTCSLVVIL